VAALASFLDRDTAAQQRELSWAKGMAGGEDILLSTQSDTEGYFGRLGKAREFSKHAIDSALGNKRKTVIQALNSCSRPSP
jgi:hypothetical protein